MCIWYDMEGISGGFVIGLHKVLQSATLRGLSCQLFKAQRLSSKNLVGLFFEVGHSIKEGDVSTAQLLQAHHPLHNLPG